MRFTNVLADGYGISKDYAILVEATWHRDTPTQDELREVPYYSHKQKLPKGVAEFVVTSRARRAINDGEDLQEIIDRIDAIMHNVNGLSHKKDHEPSLIKSDLLKFSSIKPPNTKANIRGGIGKS